MPPILILLLLTALPKPVVHATLDSTDALAAGPLVHQAQAKPGLTFVPGKLGQAARCAGEVVGLKLQQPLPRLAGTIALWVRPTAEFKPGSQHIFCYSPGGEGSESADNLQLQWLTEGQLLGRVGKLNLAETRFGPWRPTIGQWVHLAMTWDARSLDLYVDGAQAVTKVAPDLSIPTGNQLFLGAWSNGDRPAEADLDEVLVFDQKLTAEQVAQLAGGAAGTALGDAPAADRRVARPGPAPPPGDEPGLVLYLDGEQFPVPWLKPVGKPRIQQAPGRVGRGLHFVDGGLAANLDHLMKRDQGTFAMWLKPDWGADIEGSRVFLHVPSAKAPSVDNYHLQIWGNALSTRAGALANDQRGGAGITSAAALKGWQKDEWHHVALTWSPVAVKLYLDGALLEESTEVAYPYEPSDTLTIGSWQDGQRCCEATLDEVRVYDRPLSEAEVAKLAGMGG